jgi:hypothetical protein
MTQSTEDLPAPEGPMSARVSRSREKRTSRSMRPWLCCNSTSRRSLIATSRPVPEAQEKVGRDEDAEAHGRQQGRHGQGRVEIGGRELRVDGQRQGLRDPLEAAGEEGCRAKLAESARPSERRAGRQALARQRHGHPQERS